MTCGAFEAKSEAGLTVFTIDEANEDMSPTSLDLSSSFIDFAAKWKELHHFVAPPIKSSEAFGTYIDGRMTEMKVIIDAFLQDATPENVVATLIGADKETILEHMEYLRKLGQQCFEQDALREVLRPTSASKKADVSRGLEKAFEE